MSEQSGQPSAGGDDEAPPTRDEPDTAGRRSAARPRGRRWFLGGLLGVLGVAAGAGAGVGIAVARRLPRPLPHRPPADLLAARAAESRLLAGVAAVQRRGGAPVVDLAQLRRDHEAHRAVIDAELSRFGPAAAAARTRAATSAGRPPDSLAALRTAERAAARAAAARAGRLAASDAPLATVFASIAACEATHAELLG